MSLLDALIEDELTLPPVFTGNPPSSTAREIWICLRKDGATGDGSHDNPFDGSSREKFDTVMREKVISGSTVRLGPGVFETRGGSVASGWFATNGRIIGSGMFVTTLKLIDVDTAGTIRAVVQSLNDLNGFEISDITLDANIQGQPNSSGYNYARVTVAGLQVGGTGLVARRVRVINAGTQTPLLEWSAAEKMMKQATDSWECFPFFLKASGNPGALLDNCIFEQPGRSNARETTCLNAGSSVDGTGTQIFPTNTIRNCLVDGRTDGHPNRPVAIKSITRDGTDPKIVTFEFWEPHYKAIGEWVYIQSVGTIRDVARDSRD